MNKEKKERNKFKDTKIGIFLKEKAPDILDKVADVLPDKGALGIVKNIIDKDEKLSAEDKETALKLIEQEITEMQEVTKRWEADMLSDNFISKIARPSVLLYSWVLMTLMVVLEACGIEFSSMITYMVESLCMAVNIAYFGSRGIEKYHSRKLK